MSFRKTVFWIHLASGLVAGGIIAIMSATGIAIAFKEEILQWFDRHVSRVDASNSFASLSIDQLQALVRTQRPDFPFNYLVIHSAPRDAYQFRVGYEDPLYVDPYTGALADSRAHAAHEFLHTLEVWHRFLGMGSENTWLIGRHINGAANLAFLLLCLTGLYLWFPRAMKFRLFKNALFLKRGAKGKVRDLNWHNVFGIWSLPILALLAATAVAISYEWGHKIPFLIFGEEPTNARNFGMMAVTPAALPHHPPDATPLPIETLIASTQQLFPDWQSIGIPLDQLPQPGKPPQPVTLDLTRPDYMPSRAWTPVEVDPFTGHILQFTRFQDRSPGLRARVWARFLHTGAGFGIPGKIVASLASAASLILVYTGFALAWRRFAKPHDLSRAGRK